MFVKTGDTVKVIAGKDRGTTGKVIKALPKVNKVVVEGVAIMKKHKNQTQKTQVVLFLKSKLLSTFLTYKCSTKMALLVV